jgi:hypothetical protein
MSSGGRSTLRRCAAWLLVLAPFATAAAAPRAEVYRAQHRTAEELLPYAEAVLGDEGRAVVDAGTNALVLMSERPELLRDALALLAAQDRALRTVVLEYASRRASELEAAGLRVDWSVATGGLRIGNLPAAAPGSAVRVAPRAQSDRADASLGGTVRILEGHAARIVTGERAAFTTLHPAGSATTLVPADSGLEARARVLGDGRVHLELRPFEARLRPDGRIETSEAATTLTVEPGRTVVIGGLQGAESAAGRAAFGASQRRRTSDERLLTITVRVE